MGRGASGVTLETARKRQQTEALSVTEGSQWGAKRETGRREAGALVIPRPAILTNQEGGREAKWGRQGMGSNKAGEGARRAQERSGRGLRAGTGWGPQWPGTGFPWHNSQLCALYAIPDRVCLAANGIFGKLVLFVVTGDRSAMWSLLCSQRKGWIAG